MSNSTDYTSLLNKGVNLRTQAKALKEEAKAMDDEANGLFIVALNISGQDKLTHERGTVSWTSPRSKLNKEKLVNALVNKGASATIVAEAIAEATEVGEEKKSATFRENKQNG